MSQKFRYCYHFEGHNGSEIRVVEGMVLKGGAMDDQDEGGHRTLKTTRA